MKLSFSSICLMALFASLISGCSWWQHGAISVADDAIAGGNYQKATKYLADAWHYRKPTPATGAEICYKLGICYEKLGKEYEADKMFQYAMEHYTNTPYAALADCELQKANPYFNAVLPTVFKAYDEHVEKSVTTNWYKLVGSKTGKEIPPGKVTYQMVLHQNGSVSDLLVLTNTSNPLAAALAGKAITNSAPFGVWSKEIMDVFVDSARTNTFTFYYWY